jgi:hypothetical protein
MMDSDSDSELVFAGVRQVLDRYQVLEFHNRGNRIIDRLEAEKGTVAGGVHDPAPRGGDGLVKKIDVPLLELSSRLIAESCEVGGGTHHIGERYRHAPLEAPHKGRRQHGLEADDLGHAQRVTQVLKILVHWVIPPFCLTIAFSSRS